ncbi:MAG: hypothetical protein R3E97_19470 [Candidatus Eisenbacteria bacterium]
MELWSGLRTTGLTPTRLWLRLDPETRLEAATALYEHDWEGDPVPHEANLHIAQALKFRPQAVRKIAQADRIKYLAKAVRPDRSLVSSLLLSLHLEKRKGLMATFLDAVGVPHENGLIDEDFEFPEFETEKLTAGIDALLAKHEEPQVDLYLVTLYMMDPRTWQGLIEAMRGYVKDDPTPVED